MRRLFPQRHTSTRERVYELLLALCLMVLVSFAFPSLSWLGSLGYSLIAIVLTQLVRVQSRRTTWREKAYQLLGVVALSTQLIWVLTPVKWTNTGVPLVLSWSVLVGWSVLRLVESLASARRVSRSMLMGAAAGYLLLGLTAGLVMSGVETIQPNSFEPLEIPTTSITGGDASVLQSAPVFARINYFAFVCLTTVGFGDINPMQPLSRILAVITGIAGPLYLAVVMGVLISRYTGEVEEKQHQKERFEERLEERCDEASNDW